MTASQRLRKAWWQSVFRLLLVAGAAALLGALLGAPWPFLALAGFGILAWHYHRLHRVLDRLYRRRRLPAGDGGGLWDELELQLHQRQREARARTRRLVALVRGYRRAATLMPDGALLLDRTDGRIHWFNRQARQLLGLAPARLGQPVAPVFPANVQHWLEQGQVDEPLLDVPCPVDPQRRLSLRLIAYSDTLWLLVVRDITTLLRLEQVRRDFVANVSHELRTPLTVMHGYLDIIEPEDYPELAVMLGEMRKQSSRMAQLVEDLLTLSRLEARESLDQKEVVGMAALLATLRREAEALSGGRHQIHIEDHAQVDLLGSTRELHSAFSNLVSNAVRYTPTGGTIIVRHERTAQGGTRLSVQDSGYGIPAQHLPRLTERFYRVSSSRTRESGGTGLGLSIVKHVLNLHHARLEIDSEVGRGSTFSCVFTSESVAGNESHTGSAG